MSKSLDFGGIEVIKDKLYFTTNVPSRADNASHYFTVEDELTYEPFFADFGPLNLGHVYSYCRFLDQKIKDDALAKKKIYHYSSVDGAKRTNAVFLLGSYCVLVQRWTPEAVYRIFDTGGLGSTFMNTLIPFRDASVGPSTYGLTVLDCWKSLIKANSCGFFDLNTFDPNEYYFYERVENGDMNWIVPGKFLAFSGPHASHHSEAGLRTLTPDDYIPYFKKHNVAMVVRLNKKVYDKKRFTDYGVKHVDMYFVDGSTPSDSIVQRFLEVVESEAITGGAIAVHCKAGLGRTGTLIGCSLMKHHKFTAQEAIGWLRVSLLFFVFFIVIYLFTLYYICRPGSVIGPQQHFLVQMQSSLWKEGDAFRKKQQPQEFYGKNLKNQRSPTDYIYEAPHTSTNNTDKTRNAQIADPSLHKNISVTTPAPSHGPPTVPDSIGSNGSVTASSSPSINTKERLKADMRLITATLKSMRTTPPTTPTLTQTTPKFSHMNPADASPYSSAYANNNISPSHNNLASSGGSSVSSTTNVAYTSTTSPSSFYLNSPYAAVQTKPLKTAVASAYTPSSTGKGKSPSGLSLQHRKIENQANRTHSPASPPSRLQTKTTPTLSQKPTRSMYDRNSSPTSTRSLFSSPNSPPIYSSTPSSPVTPTTPTTTTTTSTTAKSTYQRKIRSNTVASFNPSVSSSSLTTGMAKSVPDFTPQSTQPMRSISNSSPASQYNYSTLHPHSSSHTPSSIRSKTPSPPRRHPSTDSNYTSYLIDAYQKKPELRYLKH